MISPQSLHLPASVSTAQSISSLPMTLEEFEAKIFQEFVTGSAIDPALFRAAVEIRRDIEILATGDVEAPIHEALNWRYGRFGKQATPSFYGALLHNEDGSCWQAKLSHPLFDQAKQKIRKYETPKNGGSRAFFPSLPPTIRNLITHRHSINVPMDGSFWEWLIRHPELPIVITEGGKKSLSLLSCGYVAIGLYGVNGGYRKQLDDSRLLINDLLPLAVPERTICLAFDEDTDLTTQRRVNAALRRFGGLLRDQKCEVSIATWDGQLGKGVDDLIVNAGEMAWEECYAEALPLKHWQIAQRLEGQLTYVCALRLSTHDLSTLKLSDLPTTGIVAIFSCKGTGKSKFIGFYLPEEGKVLAAGHRVCLMRNLCSRLSLDYRGDLDKVKGRFIDGAAYTLRVGFCVDSLLAIDPEQFSGCVLVLDEVVQVLRHLLTSSTCAKNGKRPALLARLRQLVRAARQVIIADADLDDASIRYIQELRAEDNSVFLIQNDYKPEGYPVRFINSPDRSSITAELIAEVQTTAPDQTVFVATDSKTLSKTIAQLIQRQCPDKQILLINSETSGGEAEREFIQTPDLVLARKEYDVIICSPSVATGVSIEIQGTISKVYGIFTGGSSCDADIAQALSRVREPVERVVWCSKYGSNFSKVSRSTNPLEIRQDLQRKMTASISLVRSSLREDIAGMVSRYDGKTDPHIKLYSHISAAQNFAMRNLFDAVLVRLKSEGHHVVVEERSPDPTMKLLLAQTAQEAREMDAEALVAAADLSLADVLLLERKESISLEEQLALKKFYLKDFYGLDVLTPEDVLWDRKGKRRSEVLNLEAQLSSELAVDRTLKSLEAQTQWEQGFCPWDLSHAELRRRLRHELGIGTILEKSIQGWQWTHYDLAPYAAKAREMAPLVKIVLNFSISPAVHDVQIIHQLLSQLGIKIRFHWSSRLQEHLGKKLRVYSLDPEHWQRLSAVLERRQVKRAQAQMGSNPLETTSAMRSPRLLTDQKVKGDLPFPPPQSPQEQTPSRDTPPLLLVQKMWNLAHTPAEKQWIEKNVPPDLLRRAIS